VREVGAFEAKNKLGQLLDLVERGEEVTITRHGKEVARLVPVKHGFNREEAGAAVRRIRVPYNTISALWRSFRRCMASKSDTDLMEGRFVGLRSKHLPNTASTSFGRAKPRFVKSTCLPGRRGGRRTKSAGSLPHAIFSAVEANAKVSIAFVKGTLPPVDFENNSGAI
jgi:prevent-host-death family protein